MNISKFSQLTGLSPHTLRYYEKLGLLIHISRSVSGHRSYSVTDAEWVRFISRLKVTGMPLKQILEYAQLRKAGASTFQQRRLLLEKHRQALQARIDNDREHLQALDEKIAYYETNKPLT